jgi:hypothetical protein
MLDKMMLSAMIVGLIGGYAAMLYAFVHLIAAINDSYLLSLAM